VPITDVSAGLLRVPLTQPVRNGTATITEREYVMVRITTDSGMSGAACCLARGGDLVSIIRGTIAPLATGRGEHEPQRITTDARLRCTPFLGTDGQVARAISVVDMALWDLHAKGARLPMADLLGAGGVDRVPVMAASGYYTSLDPATELAAITREFADLAEQGYHRLKIMAGAVAASFDAERIAAAVDAAKMPVGVDVNGAWRTTGDARLVLEAVPSGAIEFIEEPFPLGEIDVLRRFRCVQPTPIAIGEWETDARYLRMLMEGGLIDLLRLDVTAIGGVTGWLAASALATSFSIPVLPHYFPFFHAPLLAATPTALAVEVIPVSSGAENFQLLLRSVPPIEDGFLLMNPDAGFGLDWDWEAIEAYTQ
jgi:L-alanine-DL-glutamate epimerase-like enolase superfamily enzyme